MRKITLNLTARADGRFAKKVDGKYYIWSTQEIARTALIEMARQREGGIAQFVTAAVPVNPPLRTIADMFYAHRKPHVSPGTLEDYDRAIKQFLKVVGRHRLAESLAPADFKVARDKWEAKLGPWKIDNRVQCVRTMFRWAADTARLIDRIPWYGDSFHKTPAADKRRAKRAKSAEHGDRVFTLREVKAITGAVDGQLKAFVLLGLNGGMYAADIAQLVPADIRIEGRLTLIDNDRIKTGVRRRFVLWPETVEAIKACRRGEDVLFVTSHGNPWVNGETNSIGMLFGRLLDDLDIRRKGVGFGALRHTHVSAVGAHPDRNAARLVRGHLISGIEDHYDFPDIKRIKAVTDLARVRLLKTAPPRSGKRRAAG